MSIQFGCSSCGESLKVPDGSSGRKVKCPQCESVNVIPDGASAQSDPLPPPAVPSRPTQPPTAAQPPAAPPSAPAKHVESTNPFQAPAAESYGQPKTLGTLSHCKVEMGDVLTQAWRRYKPHIGPGVLFALAAFGVQIVFGFASGILQAGTQAAGIAALVVVGFVGGQLFQQFGGAYVQLIGKRFGLRVGRGQSDVLSGIFSFDCFGKILGMFLLVLLVFAVGGGIAAAPAVISGLLDDTGGLLPIGIGITVLLGVLLFIAFIVFVLRFLLSLFFIVDRNETIFGAFKQSTMFMQGNKLTAFVTFFVVSIVGGFASVLTCFIGLFFFIPFFECVQSVFYLKVTGQYQDIAAD